MHGEAAMFRQFQEFLDLVAVGSIMVLAAAVHSPYAESLVAIWAVFAPHAVIELHLSEPMIVGGGAV
jgi:hypothetical protein